MFVSGFLDSTSGAVLFTFLALLIFLPLLFRSSILKWLKQYVETRIVTHYYLKKQKRKLPIRDNLQRNDLSAEDVGIVPSPIEYELENPSTQTFDKNDGIHFVGISSDGHMIDICIHKVEENLALVWVYLKLSDGTVYKLPSTDTRKAYIACDNSFSSSGLQIKCLSPMRRWRISFNGLLEKCNYLTDENEMIHARFSFVWLAMSLVQEQNLSFDEKDLTDAFMGANHTGKENDLKRLQEIQSKYEQWGQMMGTITFKNENEQEYYFWTTKTRISDSLHWNEELMSTKFYMFFMDGTPLNIESLSIRNLISNLMSGYSISNYGAIIPISQCSFSMNHLKEMEEEMKFSYVIKGQKRTVHVIFLGGDVTLSAGPELQAKIQIRPFKVTMNGCDEGFGILHHLIASSYERNQKFKFPPLLLKDPGFPECEKALYLLEDEKCRSSLIAGGKGSSLALLTELSKTTNEFVVPKGFVISTKAFKDHLNCNKNASDAVLRLKDVSCKVLDKDLKTECNKCKDVFASTQLSVQLKIEIKEILGDMYESIENIRFSVRSSAFGEDSEDLSAAGQMLTILGVKGIENVYKAVTECWASKFSFEAVQYSRQNGQSILSPMAVVVQEMVPSDFSGVMFTVDPVTGDPTHPYITANFGLGETVVSALADPDTVVLKREKDQSVTVLKSHVGSKETQVFMRSESGVEQKNYANQSQNSCLTNEWATKIGSVGVLIESCFCSPRDIEWAVHKNQLYLLQARPITTLHNETDFELIHDQDTPVRSIAEYWTRANTGEVFLGATSPLGIALVVAGMDIYAHRGHVLREKCTNEFCPYFLHILPATHRQICLNIVDMLFKSNEKEITSVQKAFEIALFGRSVITEEIHQAGIKKYGYASRTKKFFGLLFIPVISLSIPKAVDKLRVDVEKYSVPLETYTSAEKTWKGILDQMNFCSRAFHVHGMATFLSSYYNMMLMTILAKGKKEWDNELYCDFATLLSSCSAVESADVPESLQELATTIAKNQENTFSSLPVDVAYNLLKNDTGASGKLFKKFIEKHGHRCVKEFDLYSKSWRMQPESLIPTLQVMVKSPNILKNSKKETLSSGSVLSMLKTPLSAFNKKLLKLIVSQSRKYVSEREKTKSLLIKIIDWLRKSCYQLGDLMVKEGMLPDAELVFFLNAEEIQDVLRSQKPGMVSKAIRRRRLHGQLNELKLPEIIKGIPKPIQTQQDLSNYSASFTLKGTPVCQGTVKARAVVVLTLDEASQVENGDILITHATDTGWSPYFPLLSGVVTVLGGLISHGAVVAREFGLPCVVGVENATDAFKTGDIVILNGTEGTVTKIFEEKE